MGAAERALTSSPVGVVLGQVGTPDAPTPAAVRKYLKNFLSDRRVVDYPAWLWQPLLRLVILPTRSRRSASLYQRIWTPQGSPLLIESEKQRAKLQAILGDRYRVVLGMAYAGPSFEKAFDDLIAAGCEQVVVVPMFPQYSSATTASVYDAVFAAATDNGNRARVRVPAVSCVEPYFDHPGYIGALCVRIRDAVAANNPDHIVLSFHGLPQRYISSGDPYLHHCRRTVELLAVAMGWTENQYTVSFQSRFGPEKWIEPSTADVLTGLHARGVRRPLVVAPGFTTDCLETLDELGNEGRHQFGAGGGEPASYAICPCLNDEPGFLQTLAGLVTAQPAATKP
ncbi:MAG TPA: ferrochelatase [Vicinamibacterales bacterium]|nr:ferrochelatase [Vicinamibacterales bacterium]